MSQSGGADYSAQEGLRPEIIAAYREAKARGLPDGWTCTIDKRNRRKWTAPNNGRSCDSIPKALAISVDLGLLPPDTKIPSGKRKRVDKPKGRPPKKAAIGTSDASASLDKKVAAVAANVEDDDDEEEETPAKLEPPSEPLDPETSLDGHRRTVLPQTVHWDPNSPDGRKIGWKVRIAYSVDRWAQGRILRYDPHSHKHKLLLLPDELDEQKLAAAVSEDYPGSTTCWIWIRNQQHNLQLATRMVWAHVKGYAWWPALVMETNDNINRRAGYVQVEFFGSGEVSTLRDSPECIRPFSPYQIDPVVAKHKKKRNTQAFELACLEFHAIRKTRNQAALFYASKAVNMAQKMGNSMATASGSSSSAKNLVGKRVEIFRSDVNYPYGAHVLGHVRKYSLVQKKWLVAYDRGTYSSPSRSTGGSGNNSSSSSNNARLEASWINLHAKECLLRVKKGAAAKEANSDESLIPFMMGYQGGGEEEEVNPSSQATMGESSAVPTDPEVQRERSIVKLLTTRCRGCVEPLDEGNRKLPIVVCEDCNASFHLGCFDPPLSLETWQRFIKDGTPIVCSQCTPCRGCYQKDLVFGSHAYPAPAMLSLPSGESLDLCSACRQAYQDDRFCPNCAHSWDDKRYQEVLHQIEWAAASSSSSPGSGRKRKSNSGSGVRLVDCQIEDTELPLALGSFTGDDILPTGVKVDPAYFHPETSEWGYTEVDMLVCDQCGVWVHAGCAGISEEEYEETSDGKHPIYSKEFLCRMCCRKRCVELINELGKADGLHLFAEPVNERVAPNYHDVIKNPMDLQTMLEKAESEEYLNYSWVREMFELMVLNALVFNRIYTKVWNEAKRYYYNSLKTVFGKIGKAAPPGKYHRDIEKVFAAAEEARKKEADRVQVDDSVEKKDLVAGSLAASITLPKLRDAPPDQKSCVPYQEVEMNPVDAFYSSWMDTCYCCGSSGASDTMLFCVDCGEAFHSFCANAPIHSMDLFAVAGWRCPNCKIDETSGEVPPDEAKMLFCEKCDRGFCVDLLDPPLTRAPPGLWICGQCVDCDCKGKLEPSGPSLRHWSRLPDKCFRCGGCEGIDDCTSTTRCQVCSRLLRRDDPGLVDCHTCGARVHTKCDMRAADHAEAVELASRLQRAQKEKVGTSACARLHKKSHLTHFVSTEFIFRMTKTDHYLCPQCNKNVSRQQPEDVVTGKELLDKLVFWGLNVSENLPLGSDDSKEAIIGDMVEAMDWKVRYMWRDEYLALIRDGIRLLCVARTKFGDPRVVLKRIPDCPPWKISRAFRFVALVGRNKFDEKGCDLNRIESIVLTAKLAASFIDLGCKTLSLDANSVVTFHNRYLALLAAPTPEGTYDLPIDTIRLSSTARIDDATEGNSEGSIQILMKEASPAAPAIEPAHNTRAVISAKIAKPLCGWTEQIPGGRNQSEWKDPRECCLCHICGDDDAGFFAEESDLLPRAQEELGALGRLLPMPDGYWVHTSCALWSSEVWEAPTDGIVHSVEKARSRGAQLKCFGCGRPGATVGCNKSNCPFNYHFPCAKACGAVFTANQRVYCSAHRSVATSILAKESCEPMKALMIEPEKKTISDKDSAADAGRSELCLRVGSLTVHSLGTIDSTTDAFHSENYITPQGYVATRIFWSTRHPRTRTLYVMKIQKSLFGEAEFVILPGDDPSSTIRSGSASIAYNTLMERVRKINVNYFSQGDLFSKLPMARRTRKKTFGLNGPQFFGYGLDHVRKRLESMSGVEAVVSPLTSSSPKYRFCFVQPNIESILDLQRKRAAVKAEEALENSTGCARTEGIKAVTQSGGSGRITRALVRSAEEDVGVGSAGTKQEEKARADRNLHQVKYRRMKKIPIEERLVPRRSHIHGWGLFTKRDIPKDDPIVEYMGEIIRQPVGDKRERAYEISGEGSCYMFRLDLQRIVDATKIGCMARFMNHSCQPNAYAKIITVDTDQGQDRKIVVFANRRISSGEEITYDYKFPVEDGSLRCTCGAPNCIGRLN